MPDILRLRMESEWDRLEKRYVRTNWMEALNEMVRRGVLCHRGWEYSRKRAAAELASWASNTLERGDKVNGYAFYTFRGKLKRICGKDFALHFGQFNGLPLQPGRLSAFQVGELACECLANHVVQHEWNRAADQPIRIVTASISHLS